MAVVQPITENRQQLRPVDTTPVQAADFSGGKTIGDAVAQLGRTGGQVAEDTNAIDIHLAEVAARDADNRATAARQSLLYEGDTALFNLQGRNALNAAPEVHRQREQIDRDAIEQLQGNPLAQRMYRNIATQRNATDGVRISEHLRTEGNRYEDSVDEDGIRVATSAAVNASSDPHEIMRQLDTQDAIVARNAIRHGIGTAGSPEVVNRQRRAAAALVGAVADRIRTRSIAEGGGPSEAQAFIVSMSERIDPQEATRLLGAVADEAAQQQAIEGINHYLVYTDGTPPAEGGPASPAAPGAHPPVDPNVHTLPGNVRPTPIPPTAAIHAAIAGQESRHRERDVQGRLVTSSAGAQGMMQVMPTTNTNPGYGVRPARDNSDAERTRVGRDYYDALLRHYNGNVTLALTAYNWGPDNVDDHMRSHGDPRTGRISDAAWLATIPITEARNYAPSVLRRVGVNPSASAASPQNQAPAVASGEINLEATIQRIQGDHELTYAQQHALIGAATERHGLAAETHHNAEEQLTDQAYTEMNRLGNHYTDYAQLPLPLRQQLQQFPVLEARLRGAAETNQRELRAEARAEEAAGRHGQTYFDMLELANGDPTQRAAFMRQDFRTAPGLTTTERAGFIETQGSYRRAGEAATARGERVNMGQINRLVSVVIGSGVGITSGRRETPEERNNRVLLADHVRQRAEAALQHDPTHPLTDQQITDLIAAETQPVSIVTRGRVWGESRTNVPAYRAPTVARQHADTYLRTERPVPAGVPEQDAQQITDAYRRGHNGLYPSDEDILRLYDARHGGTR